MSQSLYAVAPRTEPHDSPKVLSAGEEKLQRMCDRASLWAALRERLGRRAAWRRGCFAPEHDARRMGAAVLYRWRREKPVRTRSVRP